MNRVVEENTDLNGDSLRHPPTPINPAVWDAIDADILEPPPMISTYPMLHVSSDDDNNGAPPMLEGDNPCDDDLGPPPSNGNPIGDDSALMNGDDGDHSGWRSVETYQATWHEDQLGSLESVETEVCKYNITSNLGHGAFGYVYEVNRVVPDDEKPPRKFALKVLSRHRLEKHKTLAFNAKTNEQIVKSELDQLKWEMKISSRLYHRNVVLLFEIIDDIGWDQIGLVTEFMSLGISMKYDDLTGRFFGRNGETVLEESTIKLHLRDLVEGLMYLHTQGVAHRDIKPENLLISENGCLRLGDFGSATKFDPRGAGS